MNGSISSVTIRRTEYDSLIRIWKRNKLKESWVMQSYQSADAYCDFLERNRNEELFLNYQLEIDMEIKEYQTTDEEIFAYLNAMIPSIDIS